MDIDRAFKIFNVNASSAPELVRKRYRDLAAVWHPDRQAGGSRLNELSADKMKDINLAYETIRAYLADFTSVVCPHCGADNRQRKDFIIDYATCSACAKPLRRPVPASKRMPCADRHCAGTISSNGRCFYCGKPADEVAVAASDSANLSPPGTRIRQSQSRKRGVRISVSILSLAASIALLAYTHWDLIPRKSSSKPAPEPVQTAVLQQTPAPGLVAPKPLIFKSDQRPYAVGLPYYRNLLLNPGIKAGDILEMQIIFRAIGYDLKSPDGTAGEKTIVCLFQYAKDFGYTPGASFPDCFFKHSRFHYQVSSEHKDWLELYSADAVGQWIDSQPPDMRDRILELPLDQPGPAIQLIRRYKFSKSKPLPHPAPETGIIRNAATEASGQLRIKTRPGNNDFYVKMIDRQTRQEALSAYIRAGSTLEVKVPNGIYLLKYAAGQNWYGLECLFGTTASFGRYPEPVVLSGDQRKTGGLTLDLVPSRHGLLMMEPISEYDF